MTFFKSVFCAFFGLYISNRSLDLYPCIWWQLKKATGCMQLKAKLYRATLCVFMWMQAEINLFWRKMKLLTSAICLNLCQKTKRPKMNPSSRPQSRRSSFRWIKNIHGDKQCQVVVISGRCHGTFYHLTFDLIMNSAWLNILKGTYWSTVNVKMKKC